MSIIGYQQATIGKAKRLFYQKSKLMKRKRQAGKAIRTEYSLILSFPDTLKIKKQTNKKSII